MSTDEIIINGLVSRRGPQAAHRYADQTLRVYRSALLSPQHFASTAHYRRAFIMTYLFYKHYLRSYILPPDAADNPKPPADKVTGKRSDEQFIAERERRIDAELSASMPASDPPSWTLGGSCIGQRRRH